MPSFVASGGRPSAMTGLAIGFMLAGMLLFSLNDLLGKWLVSTYSPLQVVFVRSVAALLLLAPLLAQDGLATVFRVSRPGLHFARTAFGTVDVICFYFAVIYLPLADVMAFYMAAPIFVAAMSPFVLGERVGWRRWTAVVIGFAGVIIALDPSGATLALPALVSILGASCFASMVVTTRLLGDTGDKVLVAWQTLGALAAGLVAAPFIWVPPSGGDTALMAILGVVSLGAHMCVTRSLKLATAATVAPYQYTLIVWAILFGYPVFGDVPTTRMLVGAGIIVAAGLFILWRDRVRSTPADA